MSTMFMEMRQRGQMTLTPRLQQSVRAHAIRSGAHLNVGDDFALHPLKVSQRGHQHTENDRGLYQADENKRVE